MKHCSPKSPKLKTLTAKTPKSQALLMGGLDYLTSRHFEDVRCDVRHWQVISRSCLPSLWCCSTEELETVAGVWDILRLRLFEDIWAVLVLRF